jgi:hypothetical protein
MSVGDRHSKAAGPQLIANEEMEQFGKEVLALL